MKVIVFYLKRFYNATVRFISPRRDQRDDINVCVRGVVNLDHFNYLLIQSCSVDSNFHRFRHKT